MFLKNYSLDESIKQNIVLGEINEKVNDQKLENAIKLANLNDYRIFN